MSAICTPPWTSKSNCHVLNVYQTSCVARYTLVQLFSKFGTISKLDYLFHKAGPMKGKPRGYAFIEYSNQDVRCPF